MKIYSPKPNNELFKVTNVESFKSKGYVKRLTKKHPLWEAFVKIKNELIYDGKNISVKDAFYDMLFDDNGGNFDQPNQTLYIYVGGDGSVSVTKSLKVFSEKYRTLKGWNIRRWKEMS